MFYVTRSKDGVIRRVEVKYFNHNENKPRFTDRAVRSVVKLFSIEDSYFMNDMAKVEEMMAKLKKDEVPRRVEPAKLQVCGCCCISHCWFSVHTVHGTLLGRVNLADKMIKSDVNFPGISEKEIFDITDVSDHESKHMKPSLMLDKRDAFYDLLMALETNFNLKEETSL